MFISTRKATNFDYLLNCWVGTSPHANILQCISLAKKSFVLQFKIDFSIQFGLILWISFHHNKALIAGYKGLRRVCCDALIAGGESPSQKRGSSLFIFFGCNQKHLKILPRDVATTRVPQFWCRKKLLQAANTSICLSQSPKKSRALPPLISDTTQFLISFN